MNALFEHQKANVLGISIDAVNMEQALEADKLRVDYIAVGPVFATASKENPDPVVGVEELARIVQSVHKPVVAIGGITLENALDVMGTGVQAVAVIHNILSAPNIPERVREWRKLIGAIGVIGG